MINNFFHSGVKSSPSRLLLGYKRRSHGDRGFADLIDELTGIDVDIEKARNASRDIAAETTEQLKAYNKWKYDARYSKPNKYKAGNFVIIRDFQSKPGVSSKFKSPYKGPFVVTRVLNNNHYVVQDIPDLNKNLKPYNSILSSDKIKPWIKPVSLAKPK